MSKKASKGSFFKPRKLQNLSNEGKRKGEKERARRRKAVEEKKYVFIIATLEIVFGQKKLLDAKGPFGDNVIKNLDCKTVRIFAYSSTLYARTFKQKVKTESKSGERC